MAVADLPIENHALAKSRADADQTVVVVVEVAEVVVATLEGAPMWEPLPSDLKTLAVLQKLRGKVCALDNAEKAFQTLVTALGSADAAEKAKVARSMQDAVYETLVGVGRSMDEYLVALGTVAVPDDSEDAGDATGFADRDDPTFVNVTD